MTEGLKSNIEKLISLYESEKAARVSMQEKLAAAVGKTEEYRKQITELERQVDNLKLAGAFTSTQDNEASRKRIDKLIKEIDKCISLLEK